MDTKSKNNSKTRILVTIILLLLITLGTMCFIPGLNRNADQKLAKLESSSNEEQEVDTHLLEGIYQGCYVLYLEAMQRQENQTAADVYLRVNGTGKDEGEISQMSMMPQWINEKLDGWSRNFEQYRSAIDYCIITEDGTYEKNTSQMLEDAVKNADNKEKIDVLKDYYSDYFVLKFDTDGVLNVEPLYTAQVSKDALIKAFQQVDREKLLRRALDDGYDVSLVDYELESPVNFQVIFGIPRSAGELLTLGYDNAMDDDYWELLTAYVESGAGVLYVGALILIALLVFVMTSRKVWKTDISMERPGNWYFMEAAVIGVISILCMTQGFIEIMWSYNPYQTFGELIDMFTTNGVFHSTMNLLATAGRIFFLYTVWYLSVRFIRPVFSLGLREYIRQYSFFYQIFPWLKSKWEHLKDEVGHIDFSEKSTKVIIKVVVLNFAVLTIVSCMWFFGIGALIVYSVILFCLIKKYSDKAGRDYHALMKGVNKIAEGDLDTEITEDLGMFEPFKAELVKIRSGFKMAVDEEVKSQRMKTELITNVSHDLKTPLTAITTYVELLKKEDITEEERRSYIDTLEKKSLRLKILIEDLFEVSKATSNNITLNLVEVDVVNLLKQVSVEHTDKFLAAGLDLRWSVPDERTMLTLDSQKTYRIFENLFVNVQKYAMQGSRVYVNVKSDAKNVEITMKNMSAEELNFKTEEITERFVRGDSSRNTEGSGLGLAIARSFTEAQGGKLDVEVDGDLFKVVIRFQCKPIEI